MQIEKGGTRIRVIEPGLVVPIDDKHVSDTEFLLQPRDTIIFEPKSSARGKIWEHNIKPPSDNRLWVYAHDNSFTVDYRAGSNSTLIQRLAYHPPEIRPQGYSIPFSRNDNSWTVTMGENPNPGSKVIFGINYPTFEVEFLGYPDQLLKHLLLEQKDATNEIRGISYLQEPSGRKSSIKLRSIVLPTQVKSLTLESLDTAGETDKGKSTLYQSQTMFFIETQRYFRKKKQGLQTSGKQMRLGLASLADTDNKLRVYYGRPIYFPRPTKKNQLTADIVFQSQTVAITQYLLLLDYLKTLPQGSSLKISDFTKYNPTSIEIDDDNLVFDEEDFLFVFKALTRDPFGNKKKNKHK